MMMEDDYTLMAAAKKMRKEKQNNSSNIINDLDRESNGDSELDEEETLSSDYGDTDSKSLNQISPNYDFDGFSEDECVEEAESEEDLVLEDERDEVDYGLKFVVKEGPRPTITNPRRPKKIYKRNSKDSVLRDNRYPVAALAKLALAHYNAIQGTNYTYIGLVKAYKALADGFHFSIRFKASYLPPAQTPINFQAMLFQGIPHRPTPGRKRRLSDVIVRCVYPLPNPPQD